jgi:transcriptional regulator with XRE-family HTH domain
MENKFKELRKEKGYTQKELSEILEINQTTVSHWEIGNSLPDTRTLLKLSELYDVSIDYLLGKTDYYYPDQIKNSPALTSAEKELLDTYRTMPEELQGIALDTIHSLAGTKAEKSTSKRA